MFNKLFLLLPILLIFGCENGGGTTDPAPVTATQQPQDSDPTTQEPVTQEPTADGEEQDPATQPQEEDETPPAAANSSTKSTIVNKHNQIRAEVYSGGAISWSDTVGNSAQDYADELAANGKFEHQSGISYGENLFASSYAANYIDAINGWYGEKQYYHYDTNDCDAGEQCGHYTQIIWKDSTAVGCGKATYTTGQYNGWTVIVCRYNPPGNFVGQKPY